MSEVDEDFQPVLIHRSSKKKPDMVHLFSVIDDDTEEEREFFARRKVGFNITLRAQQIFATQGEAAAIAFSLEAVLGSENYEYLLGDHDLTDKEFEQVIDYAKRVVVGPMGKEEETTAGPRRSRRGSPKRRG
jgi:hypothetical protein